MLAAVVLVFFAAIGVAHVVYPDWFIKRSGVRKGGEMLTSGIGWVFRSLGQSSLVSQFISPITSFTTDAKALRLYTYKVLS